MRPRNGVMEGNENRVMKSAIAASVLVLSGSAYAGTWVEVFQPRDDGPSFYVDASSVSRAREMTLAWVQYRLTSPRASPFGGGKRFVTMSARLEFDCSRQTSRLLSSLLYDAKGAVVFSTNLKRAETVAAADTPDSAGHSVLQYVCSREK